MNWTQTCSKFATLASVLGVAACTTSEPASEAQLPAGSALENPIAACESERASCQQRAGAGCEDQMRACLTAFADWLRAVQTGVDACRESAAQCAVRGTSPAVCRSEFDRCVMTLVDEPGGADDDAG